MVDDSLSRLSKQGDIVDGAEAELLFVPNDQDVFPVQIQKIKETQEKDRSLRKKMRQNPKDSTKIVIENQKIISYKIVFISLRNYVEMYSLGSIIIYAILVKQNIQNYRSYHVLGIHGNRH